MPQVQFPTNSDSLPLYNAGESQIPGNACVKPIGYHRFSDSNQWAIQVVQPDDLFVPEYLVNSEQPIETESTGISLEKFPIRVQYSKGDYDPTPAIGQSWGPMASDWKVHPYRPGFFSYGAYKNTGRYGTGGLDVLPVRRLFITEVWVKSNASLMQGGSLSMQPIYIGQPQGGGGPETDSGLKLAFIYDRLMNASSESGWTIASDAFLLCHWIDGFWYVVESDTCPTSGS